MEKKNGFRSGFVVILGRPNVGKSTLMNALVGEKVAIVSPRAQTTRNRIMGVMTREDVQIVFLDTPGIHAPRNKLGQYMMGAVRDALEGIDAAILMLDATDVRAADLELLRKYANLPVKKAIVVNKIDQVDAGVLAPLLQRLGEEKADAYLPVSALKRKGLDALVDQLAAWLPAGPKYFPDDMVTDQPERVIVAEMIREKALRNLREEIPHGIGVEVLSMENQGDETRAVTIHANGFCEKDSHKGILIGKGGEMLRRIGEQARGDIERLLGQRVNLQLWVKVRPDCRNRSEYLRTLGYTTPTDLNQKKGGAFTPPFLRWGRAAALPAGRNTGRSRTGGRCGQRGTRAGRKRCACAGHLLLRVVCPGRGRALCGRKRRPRARGGKGTCRRGGSSTRSCCAASTTGTSTGF